MYTKEQIEKQKLIDEKILSERWDSLEAKLIEKSDAESAKKIRAALEDYCEAVYAGDLASWVGNLYDYETGGFYYSNSGRDNDGFLPDLESTKQAMGWVFANSIKPEGVKEVADFYPDWMQVRLLKFIKERQDENGYFYHPQWPRELTDSKPHRRGRDLNWACDMLGWLGAMPTYDTPTGVKGDGILADGTPAKNFSHREETEIVAPKEELVTPHLKDKDAFIAYLEAFDLKTASYSISNTLEAQGAQILQRDKVLKAMGADYSLCDIMVEWYAKHQDPKTGLFTFRGPDTDGLNGLMKASSAVEKIQREFPNALRSIESAIKVIEGNEPMGSVCCVMNPLCAINGLFQNIKKFNGNVDEVESFRKYIFDRAPDFIRATKERILGFKKPDGSFSFSPDHSSVTSQGHPVAVLNTNEGDVNATMIATSPVIGHLLAILGVAKIPIFTGADVMRFMNILETKRNEAELH